MCKRFFNIYVFSIAILFGTFFVTNAQTADNLLQNENIFDTLSVDLKINGSDGHVEVVVGDRITISWESDGAKRCRSNWSKKDLPLNGKVSGRLSSSLVGSITVRIACKDGDGNREDDTVILKITRPSTTTIINPVPPQPPPPVSNVARESAVAFISEHDWVSVLELIPRAIQTSQNYIVPLFVVDKVNGIYDFGAIQKVLFSLKIQKIYVPRNQSVLRDFLVTKGYTVEISDDITINASVTVVSEREFETSAQASRYASLIGAQLSVFDSFKQYTNQNLYCVGAVPLLCEQRYTREQVEEMLNQRLHTNKIVLANSTDIKQGQFDGSAILAPILAAAKNQQLIFTNTPDVKKISDLIKQKSARFGITKGFLTIIGSPDYIATVYTTDEKRNLTATADSTLYTYINNDFIPDLATGRIYTDNLSTSSSYIQRAIFYEQLPRSNQVEVVHYDYVANPSDGVLSQTIANAFSKLGYQVRNKINIAERDAKLEPQDYQNAFFVYYSDHGWYNWLGIPSQNLKDIDGANIMAIGCSTCMFAEYKNPLLFCIKAIAEGAMSYMGMLGGGGNANTLSYTSALFSGKSLGEAFWKINGTNMLKEILSGQNGIPDDSIIFDQKWGLIGDPTLSLSPKYQFPLSDIKKIDDANYEIDLSGYTESKQTYRYNDYKNSNKEETLDGKSVLIFDSTSEFGNLYVSQQGVYPTDYHSMIIARLGPVAGSYSSATVTGLEREVVPLLPKEEQIGGARYLWVYVLHYGFGLRDEDSGFFTKKIKITLR